MIRRHAPPEKVQKFRIALDYISHVFKVVQRKSKSLALDLLKI